MNKPNQELPEKNQSKIDSIKSELKELKTNYESKSPAKYLTRQETADLLHVSLSTLWHWQQKNILVPKGIGNRVLYDLETIENALVELKK